MILDNHYIRYLSWFLSGRDLSKGKTDYFSHLTKSQILQSLSNIDEFFIMGRYLVFGCLCQYSPRVYVPTRI